MRILVTISGECFDAEYIDAGHTDGREGTLFYFRLQDLVKDRGLRNVSLFLSGMEQIFVGDYDARIETVRLNVLRRAFDLGTFSFDTPAITDRYYELHLRATDFQPQKKASDEAIRRFIKVSSYWLGFKLCPEGPNPFVDFDCVEDLEYLGARSQDIRRNVRLLTEESYLRSSSAATFRNPLRVSPTSKLIREFETGNKLGSPLFAKKETVKQGDSVSIPPRSQRAALSKQEREPKTTGATAERIPTQSRREPYQRDFFISHASEDKEAIARPLANVLRARGKEVWYDDFSLKVGDSLRESIDHGLARSSFGIVILSPRFFEKHWPKKELDGLAAREVNRKKVILPVWHGVGFDEVREYSPTLADTVAVSTDKGLEYVVEKLLDASDRAGLSAF